MCIRDSVTSVSADPCMEEPAGPARDNCHQNRNAASGSVAAGKQIHSPGEGLGQKEGMRRESSKAEDQYNKDLEATKKRQDEAKRKQLEKWKIAQHAKCMFDNGRRKIEGKVELPCCGEQGQVSC